MPPGFATMYSLPAFPRKEPVYHEDVWVPIRLDALGWENSKRVWGQAIVRLTPGVGVDEINATVRWHLDI
jgi:hypothetical protein